MITPAAAEVAGWALTVVEILAAIAGSICALVAIVAVVVVFIRAVFRAL